MVDVIAGLKPVLIALAASALVFSAFGCGGDPPPVDDDDPEVGDQCDEEGETHNGLICEDGVWVEEEDPECTPETVEEDCDEDQICEDGQCVDDEEPECTPETVEEDCDEDQICEDGQCVDDEDPECTPDTVEEDCDEDQICEDNVCVDDDAPECTLETAEDDCEEDEMCDDGECVDDLSCTDPEDCPAGYDCIDDECELTELACDIDDDFYGVYDDVDVSTDPFGDDAGLGDVVQFIEDEVDDLDASEIGDNPTFTPDDPFEIDSAVVTAVAHNADSEFWVGDSEASVHLYLGDGVSEEPEIGDEVSFEVEEAGLWNSNAQITEISEWEVEATGAEVSYIEEDGEFDLQEDMNQIVRVGAELVSDADSCGNQQSCYGVAYGEYGEYSAEFRAFQASDYEEGDCLTFMGPLRAFPGIYDPDGDSTMRFDSSLSTGNAWSSVESSNDD